MTQEIIQEIIDIIEQKGSDMTLNMTQEILDIIRSGDVDTDLEEIKIAVLSRIAFLPKEEQQQNYERGFTVGAMVKVNAKLRPNYLFGHTFMVKKVNEKSVVVDVPDEPQFRRFAGHRDVRIPKTALTVVG